MGVVTFSTSAASNTSITNSGSATFYLSRNGALPALCDISQVTFTLSKVYSYSNYNTFSVYNQDNGALLSKAKGDGSSASSNTAKSFTWYCSTARSLYENLSSIKIKGDGSTSSNLMSIRSGSDVKIEVHYTEYRAPVVDQAYPQDATVQPGESAVLEARVTDAGYPASVTYKWYKNGYEVPGATGATLTVKPTTTDKYYCVVSNTSGQTVTTRTATVGCYAKPVLDAAYPVDKSMIPGESVTLEVRIATAGNPASYTYQWYKDGAAVSGATASTLVVNASGAYYCVVTNTAGSVTSRTAQLGVTSGGAIWVNGAKVPATPYVYSGGAWKVATPYCYDNGSWKPGTSG